VSALIDTKPSPNQPLVEVKNLKKYFPIRKGLFSKVVGNVRAVDDVSFAINPGETFGLVGESGCGKSTLGRVMLRLQDATGGEVNFQGRNLLTMGPQELRLMRREMQVIFQDPFGSLNPRFTVGNIIGEPLRVHGVATGKAMDERVAELLRLVGLDPSWRSRYPHEFSGGQRQRIGIARALALNPKFVVCDEAVSALDVSVQSQVINLLSDLQERLGLTYLFIAHGLNVVRHISTRIGVMYLGKMVEIADSETLFRQPAHPYTAALLSAAPTPNRHQRRERIVLTGEVPSPANPPSGCRFHTRCPLVQPICKEQTPASQQIASNHWVACHFPMNA
jgi:oligopeptide/dipeptide ABC transporter ATP-binding protein